MKKPLVTGPRFVRCVGMSLGAILLSLAPPSTSGSQLLNISTRLRVLTGNNVLIGGFILTGSQPKKVIIRAIGPSLNAAGVPGALADTVLELHDASGALIASNDDWQDDPAQAAEIQATGIAPPNVHESAIVASLTANNANYTAIVHGKDSSTGVGLIEVYDLAQQADSRLANISTRGFVDTGENVMIGGFIVGGPANQGATVVLRAIGPSLEAAGIDNALQDPAVELYDANGTVRGANHNWRDSQLLEIASTGLAPLDPREAAVVQTLAPGAYTAIVRGTNQTTGVALVEVYNVPSAVVGPTTIPDPVTVAPPLPEDHVPSFEESIDFLYKGTKPVQGGLVPGIITASNAAVIRGLVKRKDDSPLAGVRITVRGHPELGYTFTRADGQYDLAVAGGALLSVDYDATGFLPVQRLVQTPQQNFVQADDVVMIPADPTATVIAFGPNAPIQVANSSTKSDAAGSRSATIFFPAGTNAQLVNVDGSTSPVESLTIRATEYTVGPNGPASMPAQLPGTSEYTYCVAFTADEAISAGGTSIEFNQPVATYVDNFLGFAVGAIVPAGYYDRRTSAWTPSENGLVMKVASVNNGIANLEVKGNGTVESESDLNALGVTVEERRQIANRFAAGQTFWRVPVTHFTDWDYNYGRSRLGDRPPNNDNEPPNAEADEEADYGNIGLATQFFKEELPVAGTAFTLHYNSNRVPGYRVPSTIELQLTRPATQSGGPGFPSNLKVIDVKITAGGRTLTRSFEPASDLQFIYQWDGRDAYHSKPDDDPNRPEPGSTSAHVEVVYGYPMSYVYNFDPANKCSGAESDTGCMALWMALIARQFGLPGSETAAFVHGGVYTGISSGFDKLLTVADQRRVGLGGWSLTPHHFYDPVAHILFRGDGEQLKAEAGGQTQQYLHLDKVSEFFRSPLAVKAKTGEVYLVRNGSQIVKRKPDGTIVAVTAAPGTAGATAISPMDRRLDGKLASEVILSRDPDPTGIGENPTLHQMVRGPDDSIYLAFYSTIWRLDQDDRFHMVLCGTSGSQYQVSQPDGTLARNAFRGNENDANFANLAVARDGSVYFSEGKNLQEAYHGRAYLIRKISPDGRITTIAGLGGQPPGDFEAAADYYVGNVDIGKPALTARLRYPTSLAVGPDDSVYYGSGRFGIVRIKPDGLLELAVFGALRNPAGLPDEHTYATDDGQPGNTAGIFANGNAACYFLHVTADGSLYFLNGANVSIWQLDTGGILHRVAGQANALSETGNPLLSRLGGAHTFFLPYDLDVLPNGDIYYLVDEPDHTIAWNSLRKIGGLLPGFYGGELTIAATDGSELYVFDASGRHQRTIDTVSKVAKWLFTYESHGFLSMIVDRYGQITRIERDGSGKATAIVGPFGARTALEQDVNGFLSGITAPDQSTIGITNSPLGLVQSIRGQRQETYSIAYDSLGRVVRADHPNGGFTKLDRAGDENDHSVTRTTAGGKVEVRRELLDDRKTLTTTLTDTDQPDALVPVYVQQQFRSGATTVSKHGATELTAFAPDPRPFSPNTAVYTSKYEYLGFRAATTLRATTSDFSNPLGTTALKLSITQNGNTRTTEVDTAARSAINRSTEGRFSAGYANENGVISSFQSGDLAALQYAYDPNGNLVSTSQGEGDAARSTKFEYDTAGYLNSIEVADGRKVTITNDSMGRPSSIKLPGARTVGFAYGPDGRRVSVTPPGKAAYSYEYDLAGRKTVFRKPALPGVENTTIYEETFDRQLKSITLAGGRMLTFNRRASGKIGSITNSFGDLFNFRYDSFTKLSNVPEIAQFLSAIEQQNGESVNFTRSGPLPTAVTWTGPVTGKVSRSYTADLLYANETINSDPSTQVTFAYDRDTLMTAAGALSITWRSDVAFPAGTTIGGVSTSAEYDEFGFVNRLSAHYAGNTLLAVETTYTKGAAVRDQVTAVAGEAPVAAHYEYTAAGFLSSVTKNGTVVGTFSYDSNGNLVTETGFGGAINYGYDARDRLVSAGNRTFAYTDADELKTKVGPDGTTTYVYDEFGQLRRVTLPDGRLIEYSLGLPGVRLAKRVNGTPVKGFLLDDKGTIMAELDGANAIVNRFVYSDLTEAPAYLVRGSDTFRLVTDTLGSVRLVVNTHTGAIAQRLDYDEWGKVTLDTNPGFQPFGYAGGLYDSDTGLVRFGARDYDASIRRWTAPDPIGFQGGSTNLFTYVGNSPVNTIDPSGLGPGFGPKVGLGQGSSGSDGEGGGGGSAVTSYTGTPVTSFPDSYRTGGIGVNAGGRIGPLGGAVSLSLVMDMDGNVGLALQYGSGLGAGAKFGFGVNASSTFGDIYSLRGAGTTSGGSGGAVLQGGADVLLSPQNTFQGHQINAGLGGGWEAHTQVTNTHVAGFNWINAATSVYKSAIGLFGY